MEVLSSFAANQHKFIVYTFSFEFLGAIFCTAEIFVSNVGNLIVAPQLVGFLSDSFAGGGEPTAASLRLAVLCLVPIGFWAAAHYYLAIRSIVEDQARATGVAVQPKA